MLKEYVKIDARNCVCMYENVEYNMLEKFFTFYLNRLMFIKSRDEERIIGIISYSDFLKGGTEKRVCFNRSFKWIALGKDYLTQVDNLFVKSEYKAIPILDKKGKLVECYYKKDQTIVFGEEYLDTANKNLSKLILSKGYKKVTVCMIDTLSERVYAYFKYYNRCFKSVGKVSWSDVEKIEDDELLIVNGDLRRPLESHTSVYSLYKLQTELEYHFLLNRCIKNNVKLYIVTIPTAYNVWNVTQEEKERIDNKILNGMGWRYYLRNKEQHMELIQQVLGINEKKEEFIETCIQANPIIRKNRLCYVREKIGKYINVINGNRVTIGVPHNVKNYIYLLGNSFVFGPLVDDAHTLASCLQQQVNLSSTYAGYAVVNEGMGGMPIYESLKRLNREFLRSGDIVILFIDEEQTGGLFNKHKIYHLEDAFNALDRNRTGTYFIESPTHPNAFGYQLSANYLAKILQEDYDFLRAEDSLMEDAPVCQEKMDLFEMDQELEQYLGKIKKMRRGQKNGAIVMNCNPLTYGHKYLIEYASRLVEHLYIFVVQEDRAVFSFKERYEMVCACVKESPDITVLPSGRYIISDFTFPEYFTKEMMKTDTIIDTSNDVTIFGKYIAPVLNIKVRFAGEEPIDLITARYNEAMRKILPEYGVQFVEIPRCEMEDMGIISATKVREAMKKGDWELVKRLVPESTYYILKKNQRLR